MTFWSRSASATSFSVGRAVMRARMASSVDMCAGVCAARCESSARGSIVGGRRAAATAARGTDGRRSPTLHLALGLLGPLFHGLDLLLVRDDLVVVFRMTLAKLLARACFSCKWPRKLAVRLWWSTSTKPSVPRSSATERNHARPVLNCVSILKAFESRRSGLR